MSRSRRLRISISEARYVLLEAQAARRGLSINVQAWICLLDGMDAQQRAWVRQQEAIHGPLDTRGDLRRDIENEALGQYSEAWESEARRRANEHDAEVPPPYEPPELPPEAYQEPADR